MVHPKLQVELQCLACRENGNSNEYAIATGGYVELRGIFTCLKCHHRRPVRMIEGQMAPVEMTSPGTQSKRLQATVPDDIKQDVAEAEEANFAQCHKASVTMCRRALQLGLIDKGIPDKPLGAMLKDAKDKGLLTEQFYGMALAVKAFGDIGAHRRESIEPVAVGTIIYTTVEMLNKLFA